MQTEKMPSHSPDTLEMIDKDPELKSIVDGTDIQDILKLDPRRKDAFLKGIEKYGLEEGDLGLVDKFMRDPNLLTPEEHQTLLYKMRGAERIKTKTKMFYEKLIKDIYSPGYWDLAAKHAKTDKMYGKLRDKLLNDSPEPNIILISGMSVEADYNDETKAEVPDHLDIPFGTCIIEATDFSLFNLPSNANADCQALAIVELDGGYGFVGILGTGETFWGVDPSKDNHGMCMLVTQGLCQFINSKKVVIGQSNTRIKFKHKKHGNQYIRKLVHISSKTKEGNASEKRFIDVDWSHRWEVRGHWRSLGIGKIGKDRNGNLNKIGCTWVRPHVRGPDDKDLVKKIRVRTFVEDAGL